MIKRQAMSFTERYIKLPIEIYRQKELELMGDEGAVPFGAYTMLNPFEIVMYRPCYNENDEETDGTLVHLKSGAEFVVNLHIEDFEMQINHFMK